MIYEFSNVGTYETARSRDNRRRINSTGGENDERENDFIAISFFFFSIDPSTCERIFSFDLKKKGKKMYFQKLRNEDDLYRVEI